MPRLNVGTATLFDTLIVDHKSLHEFDDIEKLLDWKKIEKIVVGVAVIVERGAAPKIKEAGYEYRAAFQLKDLGL